MSTIPLRNEATERHIWNTRFVSPSIRSLNAEVVWGRSLDAEPVVRMLTRTGFEQKYVYTSMIASQ